ncbi:MAG: hypothetical protein ACLT9Y_04585 [Peptostreptococcus anaerobius]
MRQGLLNEDAIYECTVYKKAGADLIITYFAKDLKKYIDRY